MSAFIVDASATLPWCLPDEATPWTEALIDCLKGDDTATVPAHWPNEVSNGLLHVGDHAFHSPVLNSSGTN